MRTAFFVTSMLIIAALVSIAAAFGTLSVLCLIWGDLMFIMWDHLNLAMSIGIFFYVTVLNACFWWIRAEVLRIARAKLTVEATKFVNNEVKPLRERVECISRKLQC